jgi:acyl-CoA synthetase (AMP-forming)/AMP-acid ligase II
VRPRAGTRVAASSQAISRTLKATAEAWAGGWFHTGDIVRREADGSMFFVDRKKNVIRRSGENIAAVEVESALMRHPAVKAAAVAAVPIRCAATRCLPA